MAADCFGIISDQNDNGSACVRARGHVRVRAHACVRVRVRTCACVCACVMPSAASFTDPAYINSLMDKAVTDTINVQENDVVVMGSDGLWENMPDHMLLSKVSSSHAAGADPCTMAKFLVECAISARLHGENNFTVGRSAPIIGFPSPARKIPDPHPT